MPSGLIQAGPPSGAGRPQESRGMTREPGKGPAAYATFGAREIRTWDTRVLHLCATNPGVVSPPGSEAMLNYRWLSMKAVNCALGRAPTLVATSSPDLNNMRVGIPRMPNCAGIA